MIDLAPILKSKQITQTELANRLGVSRGYMSLLVNGQRDPSPALLQRIAAELGIAVGDLFGQTGFAEPGISRLERAPKATDALLLHARRTMLHPVLYRANEDYPNMKVIRDDLLIVDLKGSPLPGDLVVVTIADPQTGSSGTHLRRWFAPWLVDGSDGVRSDTADGAGAIVGLVAGVVRGDFLTK